MYLPSLSRCKALTVIGWWCGCCVMMVASVGWTAEPLRFNRDILPILSDKCFACHGPDQNQRQAGLRLDQREEAVKAAESGEIPIVPGDPNASELVARILSDDPDVRMPPAESPKQLTAAQRETLQRWVAEGAEYEQHWSFVPLQRPEVPAVRNADWARTPVDRFILAELERQNLMPRPEADRSTLIRRVAFALTGLPPTPEEVDRFLTDFSPQAYESMIDRFFDSPHFGEEMARHWLDVARYADTHGLHLDNEREMWAYRDWVVNAFNRNLPFDQFTVEQLAGDLLPNPTTEQLIATGFNRCNVTTSEGGSIEPEFLYRYAVDRASTTAQAWLGLTAGCAVCHDHKYDPLTTREFYSLYAFFYSAADPAMDKNIRNTDPFLMLTTEAQKTELDKLRQREDEARRQLGELVGKMTVADPADDKPEPARQAVEEVWLDDLIPWGGKNTNTSRNPPRWTATADLDGKLGVRALRQASAAMHQDKFENVSWPLIVPHNGQVSVWVRLDPLEPSQALMVELVGGKGLRAIWGDADKLASIRGTNTDFVHIGDLPAPGQWTRLEVSAEQLKLTGGQLLRGFTLAQFGGIVHWDGLTVRGELSPAEDPRSSFRAWWKSRAGQDTSGIPDDLKDVLKEGPEKEVANEARQKLHAFWLTQIARPTTSEWSQARGEWELAQAARAELEDRIPGTFIFRDLAQPREAFVMVRGQYDKPGERVEPGVPAVLPALQKESPQARATRLDLARWLVAPENPLTARVAVNRLWQQLFGMGLVRTSYDFGAQGESPSHPELLDWLAVHYRETGWDTKAFLRLLLTSTVFRQDAKVSAEVMQRDPENRLYARGPRFRLDAEQIRDNALAVSGLLNRRMGGPGVKPYQPSNIWEPVGYSDSNTRFYLQDHGVALYRRSIYCFLKRTAPPPFMSNFDGPNREQFCARRERSNTPLQALQLLNDVQHFEAARAFAERMLDKGGQTADDRIRFAYRAALARDPHADELDIVRSTLNQYLQRYESHPEDAHKVIHIGESKPQDRWPAPELAAYTLVANLILNLDESITRN